MGEWNEPKYDERTGHRYFNLSLLLRIAMVYYARVDCSKNLSDTNVFEALGICRYSDD
nr:unnamed protein product [Digitaria exilis]